MKRKFPLLLALSGLAVLFAAACSFKDSNSVQNDGVLVAEALDRILLASYKQQSYEKEGYWVADVAGLYGHSELPLEIAEADAAPLNPLVPHPKPYHGYLFIALESLPTSDVTVARERTKGQKFDRESCAFCAFPADSGPGRAVLLVTNGGHYKKVMDGGIPILKWPINLRQLESGWAIVD